MVLSHTLLTSHFSIEHPLDRYLLSPEKDEPAWHFRDQMVIDSTGNQWKSALIFGLRSWEEVPRRTIGGTVISLSFKSEGYALFECIFALPFILRYSTQRARLLVFGENPDAPLYISKTMTAGKLPERITVDIKESKQVTLQYESTPTATPQYECFLLLNPQLNAQS